MKALKLAVAEPSAILRCGIIAVLRRLPAPDVDILEIADISQLTVQLSRTFATQCSAGPRNRFAPSVAGAYKIPAKPG